MSPEGRDPLLARLERDALITAATLAVLAVAFWPGQPQRALGVMGGFALVAVSYRGIRAGVEGRLRGARDSTEPLADTSSSVRAASSTGLVKFFTRHAILAVGAYVMMARFEFDPRAMLAGVTAPAVAATVELVRTVRARHGGPHSRSS